MRLAHKCSLAAEPLRHRQKCIYVINHIFLIASRAVVNSPNIGYCHKKSLGVWTDFLSLSSVQGLLVGNAVTDECVDGNALPTFAAGKSLIPQASGGALS